MEVAGQCDLVRTARRNEPVAGRHELGDGLLPGTLLIEEVEAGSQFRVAVGVGFCDTRGVHRLGGPSHRPMVATAVDDFERPLGEDPRAVRLPFRVRRRFRSLKCHQGRQEKRG